MKANDFVYSLANGIGRIDSLDDSYAMVDYGDSTEREALYDLSPISYDVISFIKTGSWVDYLPFNSIERGKDVYDYGKVKSVVLMGSNLTGSIAGSHNETYNTTASFSKNNIRATCTCPVGKNCKHAAALIYFVENKLKAIAGQNNYLDSNNNEFINLALNIKARIYTKEGLSAVDEFAKYLSSNVSSNIDMERYLEALENEISDNAQLNRIVQILCLNANTREFMGFYNPRFPRISRIVSSMGNNNSLNRTIHFKSYVFRCPDLELYLLGFLVNQMYGQMLILAIRSSRDYSLYLSFCVDRMSIDEQFIDKLEEVNRYIYNSIEDVAREIFVRADSEMKEYLCDNFNGTFLTAYDLESLSNTEKLKYLNALENNKDKLKILNQDFNDFVLLDPKRTYFLIYYNFFEGYSSDRKKLLKKVYENNKTFYSLLATLEMDSSRELELDITEVINTFDISYYFYTDEEEAKFTIVFKVLLGTAEVARYELEYNGNIVSSFSTFDEPEKSRLASMIFNYYSTLKEFNEEVSKKYQEMQAKIIAKKKNEYLEAIKTLAKYDIDNGIKLDSKVNLEYEFDADFDEHERNFYALRLKIGSKKMYIVKNPVELLSAIEKKETVRYGKELEFNHRIDNFSDSDREVLDYLLSLPYHELLLGYGSSKTFKIYPKAFEKIIKLLKGRMIRYNDKDYKILLNEKNINIEIDENYHLISDAKKYDLLKLDNVYILDNLLHEINVVKASEDELALIKFVDENPDMDLSLVKKEFVDEVYAKYHDVITVPDTLKPDFKVSELKIDAYFDYQGGIVTLDTKLIKDDVLLNTEAFMTNIDRAKFRAYTAYIDSIGFIEGKSLLDNALILQFFTMDLSDLRKLCNVYLSDTIKSKQIENLAPPTIRIQYNNSMMEVFLEESSYDEEELYKIMKAIRQKKNFVLLNDDRIIKLDEDNSKEFYDTVTDLNLDIKNLYGRKRIETYDALKALAHENNTEIDDYVKNMIADIRSFKTADIKLPNLSDDTELREYQKEGYRWLSLLAKYQMGGILADDMGLGKTLEFITLFKADHNELPSLIVCPKSLVFNWYSEFEKFDGETDVRMIYGSVSARHNLINGINPEKKAIYIVSYDTLRNDIDLFINHKFNYLVLDEAQAIKNVHAQKSNSVKQIDAIHRFALTGTPIENNVIDLWSIFDFIMPGYMEDLNVFKGRYLKSDNYSDIISKKTAPFILRRTKQEVLKDLPPKFERIISCEMTTAQRKVYDAHIKDAKDKLDSGMNMEILAYLTRLRQICVDPKLFIDEYSAGSGKIKYLEELLPEYIREGHRMLIFSAFTSALDVVAGMLKELRIKYYMLTGDTPMLQRKRDTDEFNASDEIKVYLISLKAGGTGLNLIGADTVIHLDPWWNVSAENQASDRAYRIGQVRNVEVIKLVASDSIEERVIELQNIKKGVIDKIIAKDDTKITGLSLDDLKFILG